jgi:uncharacterized protein (TIGR04551 family)
MKRVVHARVLIVGLALAASATSALAQGAGQPGGAGGGFGGQPGPEENKKEGVAEEAPKTPGLLPTTPVLPAPKNRRKRWKLFELDGYFRFRTDWFKNFHLGFKDDPGVVDPGAIGTGGSPYPTSIGCPHNATDATDRPCEGNLSMANMRLKLMPTFNIDETTSVFTEVDVLDNLVLGSTADTLVLDGSPGEPPIGPFGEGQRPPVAGRNSDRDSITVRRVWAEVGLPLGILKFGRMPDHWGMGINANSGTEDTFNGGVDLDADYGDTVDRLGFSALIPGTKLRGGLATDWSTKLAANSTLAIKGREGQPWDLADDDDTQQWLLTVSQLDNPTQFKDAVGRGGFAYNWGIRFAYRTQKSDYDTRSVTVGAPTVSAQLIQRGYKAYVPDVWLKAAYKQYQLELEGVAVIGSVDDLADYGVPGSVDIRQFGGVGRFTFRGLDDKLKLGMEIGAASGDQWDNDPQGSTHISHAQPLGASGDRSRVKRMTRFMFDRDYKVDLILFRELLGTVTNAAYAKPFMSYELTPSLLLKVANVTAFAMKTVSTPGNSRIYGTEFDADIGYANNGFFAGASYGVFFPLGAMDHPFDEGSSGPGFNYPLDNAGDAGNAHTIQFRLALQF